MRTLPSSSPRAIATAARRRLRPHVPAVLQTATAATVAWWLAVLLLPTERPAFASIAAIICLGVTYGQRRSRAIQLIGGVLLGITVASLLVFVIGTGPLQIAAARHARDVRRAAVPRRRAARQRGGDLGDPARLLRADHVGLLRRPHPRGPDRRRRRPRRGLVPAPAGPGRRWSARSPRPCSESSGARWRRPRPRSRTAIRRAPSARSRRRAGSTTTSRRSSTC